MAKKNRFKREYYLHMFTQKHLKELFDLKCVASEIQHKKLRFDTLAFDEKINSFVIIEYKNQYCKSVLEQAQGYCDLIKDKENIEYFINRLDKEINVKPENTKVMIISPTFHQDQIDEAEDKDFELWKVTCDDCCITYENLKTGCKTEPLKVNSDDLKITEEMLLENRTEEVKELYKNLTKSLQNEFNDVEIKCLVNQFSIKANDNLICLVELLKYSFNIYFYADNLKNAGKTIDISEKKTGGKAKYKLKYESDDDFDYFLDLFKQTYNQKRGKDE